MLKKLFIASLISLSLGQLTAIYKSQESNLYLFDIMIGLYCIYGFLYFLSSKSLKIPKCFFLFIIFTLIASLSLLSNSIFFDSEKILTSFSYLLRWILYLGSGIVTYNAFEKKVFDKNFVVNMVLISGLIVALAGFTQLIFLPDFEKLDPGLGWDPHKYRLASTFFDPNFVGGFLGITFAFGLNKFMSQKKLEKRKPFSSGIVLIQIFIITLAIILTFSRSAWMLFSVVVLIYGSARSKKLLFFAIIVALLAYAAIPRVQTRISGTTDPTDSAYFRYISWKNTWEISKNYLFLGTGFNTFRYVQKEYGYFDNNTLGGNSGAGSDSSLLLILATTGVFGFLFFVGGYTYNLFYYVQKRNLLIVSVLLGLLVQTQFINALFYPQIMFLWINLLGYGD